MRTITTHTDVYKFDELNEVAKQAALENMAYVNVEHHNWFDDMYEDAKNIGLIITDFELDNNKKAIGKLNYSLKETVQAIQEDHGDTCETFKLAEKFDKEYDELVGKYSSEEDPERVAEDNEDEFDSKADQLEELFLKELLEAYADMLEKDYEHLTSKEAIIDTIEANEYEFTEDGEQH